MRTIDLADYLIALIATLGSSALVTYLLADSALLAAPRARWLKFWGDRLSRRLAAGKRGGLPVFLIKLTGCSFCLGIWVTTPLAVLFAPSNSALVLAAVYCPAAYLQGLLAQRHDATLLAMNESRLRAEALRAQAVKAALEALDAADAG